MALRSAQSPTAARSMLSMTVANGRPSPNATASLMLGKNLSLSHVFRREQAAVVEAPDVLRAIDDLQMPGGWVDEPASPVLT